MDVRITFTSRRSICFLQPYHSPLNPQLPNDFLYVIPPLQALPISTISKSIRTCLIPYLGGVLKKKASNRTPQNPFVQLTATQQRAHSQHVLCEIGEFEIACLDVVMKRKGVQTLHTVTYTTLNSCRTTGCA